MTMARMLKILVLAMGVAMAMGMATAAAGDAGETRVLKWKDGKQAVFLLQFDDSCASDVDVAIPELQKHGMIGTFYINPGKGALLGKRDAWEKKIPAMGMEYGNHTNTHSGVKNAAELDDELAKCNEEIRKCFPDRKWPRLVAFGQPGGVPWDVTPAEVKALLAKYNLVDRPSFYGPPIHYKTAAETSAAIDKALASGEMGHFDFHGVGGDWLVTSREWFVAILDKLDSVKDQMWVTDMVSWHKYATERASAQVKVLEATGERIKVELTSKADTALYDLPLTLETKLPAGWARCVVTQGSSRTEAPVTAGVVRYPATPGAGEIVLAP